MEEPMSPKRDEPKAEATPVKISIQVPSEMLALIDGRARRQRRSRSAEVVTLLESALSEPRPGN
jgi:metal-responsive CopG/Arc/MetJ family transcriptional regulator